ncbi:MAG: MazG family protein [Cyanobacteria bacterium P01_D01_bin.123]
MLQTLDARLPIPIEFELSTRRALLVAHCQNRTWPEIFEHLVRYYVPDTRVATFVNSSAVRDLTLAEVSAWWCDREAATAGWSCYVPPQPAADLEAIARLMAVVAQLRSPNGGCPWDRAQTPLSLTPYILEEAYETVAAIRSGDRDEIVQELGDYLFQVVLQAQIFSEERAFSLKEVAHAISDKLVRRHPHVFGPDAGDIAVSEIKRNWEAIKAAERADETLADKLLHYATTLPPLMATTKMVTKLARQHPVDSDEVWQQWQTACQRLNQFAEGTAGDRETAMVALGELLQTTVSLAHELDLDASAALRGANEALARAQQ